MTAGSRSTLAWLLACVLLAACGRDAGDGNGRAPLQLQAFGDPAEVAAYRELIAAFERSAPDVDVELIPVGKQADHMVKLTTAFSGGDPPDLFLINYRRYGQFAAKGVLEPLGPALVARGKYRESDFYEQALDAFRSDGQLMCAPQNISSLVVYYNRALFAAAGVAEPDAEWTWGHFLGAAAALTRDDDNDGRAEVYGLGFEPTLVRLAPFVWQAGGEIVDDLHRPTMLTQDRPPGGEALYFVRSWSTVHRIVPPLVENKAEDHESRFARGALGMILHSRRYTATLRTVPGLDWDVAPLPQYRRAATMLHADAYCLAKASRNKDAAFRFLEFALSPAGAEILARSGRTVPALKSVAESAAFLDPTQPPRSARVFLDSIPTIRRTPNTASWNEIEMRVDPVIEEWYHGGEQSDALGPELRAATQDLLPGPPAR